MPKYKLTIGTDRGRHVLVHADSLLCRYKPGFDLILTSPPFYHPTTASSLHGKGFSGDLQKYADFVSKVLVLSARAVVSKRVCILKTDLWHKGTLIPVGFRIVDACASQGLRLRAHWIWEKGAYFSPYGPSFANVFIFGEALERPRIPGILRSAPLKRRSGLPSSFAPEVFGALIDLLASPGGTVLDPFAGLRGVIEGAANYGRKSVGVEISNSQFRRAKQRLSSIPGFIAQA